MSSELQVWLAKTECPSDLQQWVLSQGLTAVEDFKHAFTADKPPRDQQLAAVWREALQSTGSGLMSLCKVTSNVVVSVKRTAYKPKLRIRKAGKCGVATMQQDEAARARAAEKAVELASTWGHQGSVMHGVKPDKVQMRKHICMCNALLGLRPSRCTRP